MSTRHATVEGSPPSWHQSRGKNRIRRFGGVTVLAPSVFFIVSLIFTVPPPITSQSSGTIHGVVTDTDGKPLSAARIGVIDTQTAVMQETQADSLGRFQVKGLESNRRYRVVASKYGYDTVTLNDVVPGTGEVTLSLKPQARMAPQVAPPQVPRSPSSDSAPPEATFRVAVSMVMLNVSVRDAVDTPIPTLKKSDFTILEDGAPQEIVHFAEENTPLSVVLVIDSSSSMEGVPIQEAKRAALEFLDQSHPENEIAIIAFNDRISTLQSFTQDRPQLRNAISQIKASGGTALYDAMAQAIELIAKARYSRHFIVVFSDGKDADSRHKFSQLERKVQASDAVIYAVGEYGESDRKLFMTNKKYYKEPALEVNYNPVWILQQLTELTGGKAYFPHPGEPLTKFFALIVRELHHQYVVGYVPPPPSEQPKFRTIEVRINRSAHPGPLTIRTRKGYLSPGVKP